jgi:hypothetical protein
MCTSFNLVCVYGDMHHKQTSLIWHDVSTFILACPDHPTICMGHLSELMNVRNAVPNANLPRINAFCCMVKQSGLFDLALMVLLILSLTKELMLTLLMNILIDV